ncbi:MAG TPA: SpoIIE family protein phosphatase [Rubrobacteraceae bacterium]|jgi:serine phosphatase RsbU (regulator of sigma subunit)/ketosteroid isomerase-like protein|nr:SpoIIE family protein phosphatase [Rubrobacteraceae bacterium]
MSAEQNKALVRRFFEVLEDEGDFEALDKMLAPDFISHNKRLPSQQPGREGFKWAIAELRAAYSNTKFLIEQQVAEGDLVVTRFTVRAIHDRREIMGVAPTSREVSYKAMIMHRISEGKVAEEWSLGTISPKLMRQRLEQEIRERERIEQELEVARRIQRASLPEEVPKLEGWEITPRYQPAREVGGDFYDFHLLSEGQLGLVVGDATGKGVPAALVTATTCGMLQAVSQAVGSSSPGEVLARVNETLLSRIPPNMFVTCFYAILEPNSASLIYANAGHDLPYLHRNNSTEEAEEMRATGMPLGLMPGMGYEEKETTLKAGEAALFYSDGIVEAHNPKGEMFGFPRLKALVAMYGEQGSLGERLLEELYSFTGGEGWEQEDDITLLTLRRSAARS